MSQKAEISKNLIINSPQELYQILKRENLTSTLQSFSDNMEIFIDGCTCDTLENWENAVLEYSRLDQKNLTSIKNKIKCSKLVFYLDSVKLFEI